MSNFSTGTEKTQVQAKAHGNGVKIVVTPKDYQKNGASEVELRRVRDDDGSVTITVTPKE